MLKRYTLAPMQQLWLREETKFEQWLEVELACLEARVTLGDLKPEALGAIRTHARFTIERIEELEAVYEHDLLAFVGSVHESLVEAGVGQFKEEFHKGLTSYDIEDPALILMLRQATVEILRSLYGLREVLRRKAKEHQWTLMVARTHGQFAAPSTFGHLLQVFASAIFRSARRLELVLAFELSEGKMSGAVGAYGGMDPRWEREALQLLGLKPAEAETQILQRDRHAMLASTLAVAAGSIEQMCRTFWEMMRREVRELGEPRQPRQRGSSAMPHKNNPRLTERLMGLARIVRACAGAAVENIATPEWRDISQSSAERHIFPTATGLLHYMAIQATYLVEDLKVFPDRMCKHLEETSLGVWAGQPVWVALMEAGVPYDTAYGYVQASAFEAEENGLHLRQVLCRRLVSASDPRTAEAILGPERLAQCFDARAHIERGIRHIFRDQDGRA